MRPPRPHRRAPLPALPAFAALGLLVASAPAAAQEPLRIQITPQVGYRTGGSLTESSTGAQYSINASTSWGAVADVALGGKGRYVELAWMRQETNVSNANAFGPGLSELTLDTFLVGGHWDAAPEALFRPFLSGLVGLTRLDAPGSGTTRFSAALSGGFKVMPLENFGLRFEARALYIVGGGGSSAFCGSSGCTIGFSSTGELQGDFSAGVVVAF